MNVPVFWHDEHDQARIWAKLISMWPWFSACQPHHRTNNEISTRFQLQYGQSSKSKSKCWHENNKALLAVILCMQILLIHTIPKYINYIYIIGLSLLSWHFYSPKFIYAFEPNLMTSLYRDRTAIKQRSFLCWLRTKSSQNDDNNNTSIINI